jgi:excisionase family DNA binding protein
MHVQTAQLHSLLRHSTIRHDHREEICMKPANDMQPLLHTRAEAAELLKISTSSLDILIARGLLPTRKIGRRRHVPRSALLAFAKKNVPRIWPPKIDHRTTRKVAPEKNPKRSAAF